MSTAPTNIQEHFDSDIRVLLQDKQRLQEKLEFTSLCLHQLENELDLLRQKTNANENFKDKYENLLNDFNEKSNYIEQLINDKNKVENLNEEFQKQIQSLQQDINQYSDINLIVSNQQMNISCLTEESNRLRETITNIEHILPLQQSTDLFGRIQQLMNDYQENCQKLKNDKEHIERLNNEIQTLKQSSSNENEQHFITIQTLKDEYEQRIHQLQHTG